ncbi:helix-turn-helix transcriptional regulator [uncultured Roseibium sp.]|uniref:helix-turn-helix domain-containing protein n=1 Tax=uncultured Roseibium sp. TaxID=1936171 RepID=UPI002596FB41|nr:helix-turn-helix transcriptional regulator [uncultured Roseibium sp.]
MARPENTKTELGQRLRAFRKAVGDPSRDDFAKTLGLSFKSLGNYERGDSVPDANVLLAYRQTCHMNVDWLISGAGSMFLDGGPHVPDGPSGGSGKPAVQSGIFKETGKLVHESHKAKGVTLPSDAHLAETVSRYNELVAAARNPADESELRALFPWLQLRISQDLEEAQNAPGSGKRSG